MLIHLTTDRLCQWHPYDETLSSLNCKYCIVDRSTQELRELFGTCEHFYGHWIDLSLPHGRYPLYQLLRQHQDVAPPQARDIAPLRLVSWVSCEVPDHVQHVLHQLMALFGEVAPVSSDEVLAIGVQQLGVTSRGEISWDMVRDAQIREVTFGGTTCPTEEVCRLMAEFLQRLPLPRLVHFLDMILPQMVPVQSPCQSRRRRFASSYRIAERTAWGEWDVEYTLNATKLFWSRSGIMHVAIAWDHKPLLLLATALLPNRTTDSFEREAGPPYDKQRIQMGLRSGNTVLICFRSGVGHFQSVLIALAADLHTNKPWQGQRKFWKYVSPIRAYFAWLPERLARTYCSAALDKCPDLPYGEVHYLQGSDADEKHSMVFQNIYHIGDTKSAQELEVFLRMSRERLRLCCGLQCTDRLHPNGPRQRQKLFHAALKLLWFAIGIETVRCENAAQVALHAAIRPLLRLEDGHVLATLSAIVLALCEGRTGLAISGGSSDKSHSLLDAAVGFNKNAVSNLAQWLTGWVALIYPAVGQFWHELIGDSPPRLSTEIQRAAYVILWMGLRGEREGLPSMLATSFAEAAGVSGRQKWGLVLSTTARVSQVTYQTVVGVRYPELVTFNGTQWKFGKYVTQERPLRGGFLPIFWDVPRANIHAVEDIGAVVDWLTERCEFQADAKSNLAVLHNRNDMTNLFRASNWVSSSHDSIVSRGVTTCAGMTAHTVLLAQTKLGFLTGGRKKSFLLLSEDEQMVQLEEAYARATVAITRARSLCLIMGPLDMKGFLGAATVMGTLMYGAGHVWAGQAHFYLHDGELSRSPSDETFIHMLQQNCCLSGPHFPPPAIVEALQDYVTHYYKVRRLHLIVVDLWRPWKYNTARAREITDQLWRISHGDDTHRVSPFRPDGPEPPLRCRRFAYGYALDGSECPSYLVEALHLFGLREDELLPDLHITRDGVLRIGLGAHQEHRVNHVARATDRTKVSADVIQLAAHEVDPAPEQAVSEGDASDSEGSESASDSDQNDPPSSLVADAERYELMQIAYAAVGKDFTGQEDLIESEYSKLAKLEMVPERWPLARLSFSLQTCVDHLDRVLAGCCWEVQATRTTPSESLLSLHHVAKCLTMKLAVHLAKEVAAILRAVLTHETKKLYNDSTVHLL
eukprot:symbB.v1.2.021555.t1/scaffold1847.1/size122519/8